MSASLSDFLSQSNSSRHWVIGNPAGDADSIVSALGWAFLKKLSPVMCISKADLETQRPETLQLLTWAAVDLSNLVYLDDWEAQVSVNDKLTLMDHNRYVYRPQTPHIVEIVDHHRDDGHHMDASLRHIAFEEKATVASTCTLVVEARTSAFPADLGFLLLGVILLDSVNLSPAAGKVTERDVQAVERLQQTTDYSALPDEVVSTFVQGDKVNTDLLFQKLQDAKFDPSFWRKLSVRDALRLDYKQYDHKMGIASCLLSLEDWNLKTDIAQGIDGFMKGNDLVCLIIMLAFSNPTKDDGDSPLRRQLALFHRDESELQALIVHLQNTDLRLSPLKSAYGANFDQGNSKASRKVLAPILLDYFAGRAN